MSWRLPWRSLAARVYRDYRALVLALAVILVLNVLLYAFFVYPLSQRVSNVAERTAAAEAELAAARLQHVQATATLTGKARATEDLDTFYGAILPADLASARRIVFPRLAQLARQSNLRGVRTRPAVQEERDRALTRLRVDMEASGTYTSVRRFIDQLERLPDFVVVDYVQMAESGYDAGELTVRLELSTYFRGGVQ